MTEPLLPVRPSGMSPPYLIRKNPDGSELWGRWVRYPGNTSHHEGKIEETWTEPPKDEDRA